MPKRAIEIPSYLKTEQEIREYEENFRFWRKRDRRDLFITIAVIIVLEAGAFAWVEYDESHKPPPTSIMAEVTAMGGYDVRNALGDEEQLQNWFYAQPEFAKHIADRCSLLPVQPFGWEKSPEGNICRMAVLAATGGPR